MNDGPVRGINRTIGVVAGGGLITKRDIEAVAAACTQEEPPACTAACPLHVDVRAVLGDAAAGQWPSALATLRRRQPFPAVLGRICPQPCRPPCTRGEAGDPLSVAALERAVAEFGGRPAAPDAPIPRRSQRAAVVGGGLTGATAAFDLARRGYRVTLLEAADRLGGSLRRLPEDLLPAAVVDADLGVLADLGVQVCCGHHVDGCEFDRLLCGYDAVVVATGRGGTDFGLPLDGAGRVEADPVTGATARDGVFAGGGLCRGTADGSPIRSAADGRRAATSADRRMQRVSLTGSRPPEDSVTTCLFTRTEGVEAAARIPVGDPVRGYTAEEARAEAARCLQCSCLECVKACAYLEHYGSYPKLYARRVLHNMMMVKGNHNANRLINSCSLCGLCAEVCPTGVDVGGMLKQVRQRMVQQQQMPPSAHDFALRDLEFSNSEAFAVARPAPGAAGSRYAFFPGCQLAGSSPDHVERAYGYLQDTLGDVGLLLGCCGAPADWAGRTDLFEASLADFDTRYAALGSPTLVLPCTSCYQVFAAHRPDIPLLSLWTVLAEHGLPAAALPATPGTTVSIHDPCTSRHEPQVQQDVRDVLGRLGYQVEELPHSRERTECCSYGGLMWLANREVAEKTVRRRIEQSPRDYLTYCVMCRDLFAARGKRTLHLLDLLYGQDVDARAARPSPGYTQRHENRARLKRSLLRTVWGESMPEPTDAQPLRLRIAPDVLATMEDRLILVEDVQRVIAHAEATGERLRDPRSGHLLARHRPRAVTYWVEYSPVDEESDGPAPGGPEAGAQEPGGTQPGGREYVVHRAYSHRLQLIEGSHHGR
jgi:glutamate synthase (NADPH/NADH) small chain